MAITEQGQQIVGRQHLSPERAGECSASIFWSATVYDRARTPGPPDAQSCRGSNTPGLTKNADGSMDLYFGPKAPAGKESNWVPTKGGGEFEVLFRFYGPEKPLFDKTWELGDITEVK